jgi:MFS transporter, ACS family, glucarate transporter
MTLPASLNTSVELPAETSWVRWKICLFLLFIIALAFLDRLNFSVAAKQIQAEFPMTDTQLGFVCSAFVLGYALFQVPGGALGDRFGPRRILGSAIFGWSLLQP